MVATARTATQAAPRHRLGGNRATKRASATTAPIFGATVRNAAAGTGAPSATSGIQAWAGKAPSLKARPTTTAATAGSSSRAATPSRPAAARQPAAIAA